MHNLDLGHKTILQLTMFEELDRDIVTPNFTGTRQTVNSKLNFKFDGSKDLAAALSKKAIFTSLINSKSKQAP